MNDVAISALKDLRRTNKTFSSGEVIANDTEDDILVALALKVSASSTTIPDLRGGTKYVYKILPPGTSVTLTKAYPQIKVPGSLSTYALTANGFISDGGCYEDSPMAPTMIADTFGVFL